MIPQKSYEMTKERSGKECKSPFHAVAHVHCPNAPGGGREIRVVELLTNEVSIRMADLDMGHSNL
jgi:hypothetical protein